MGRHQGCLWPYWDPHACHRPWSPISPKQGHAAMSPRAVFIHLHLLHSEGSLWPPSASLPCSPSVPRQMLSCDPRSLAEPGHRGHRTLGRRDTLPQRHEPLLLPALLRVQPARRALRAPAKVGRAAQAPRVRLCLRRAGFGQDPSSCPGARFSPARRTGHRGPW